MEVPWGFAISWGSNMGIPLTPWYYHGSPMEEPWKPRGGNVGIPWKSHGQAIISCESRSMAPRPWDSHEISMEYPWDFYGSSVGLRFTWESGTPMRIVLPPWYSMGLHGTFMGASWCAHGSPMRPPWNYSIAMMLIWDFHGTSVVLRWDFYKTSVSL